ncbi:arylalkylamine N-acetyltransferase 1-like isoform X2 [Hetaerina americana]|uniref:arylalkylamine N-acetyltransferase 1-like isoform X2 n=1 Tax=Hetaerina americana TaxID=62018 RepID=UPI003A7F24E8
MATQFGAITQEPWFGKLLDATKEVSLASDSGYEIFPVAPGDAERVIDFLRRFFFRDEPINRAVDLVPEDGSGTSLFLEAHCLSTLTHGLSLMAVESGTGGAASGRIIGVSLNGDGKPGDADILATEAERCLDPKFKRILRLLEMVERKADVLALYGEDRQFELRIISVDDSCRGRGIATALLQQSIDLAKRKGYTIFRVDCTSAFSAKAMERAGLSCVYSLSYEDYSAIEAERHGEEASPPIRPEDPHTHIKCFALRI